jgi:hypothetical protein
VAENPPIDPSQGRQGARRINDRLGGEVRLDPMLARSVRDVQHETVGSEPRLEVAPERGQLEGRDDRPMADALGWERPPEQLAAHATALRRRQDEELGQLANAVPVERSGVADDTAAVIFCHPGTRAVRHEVLEEALPALPALLPDDRILVVDGVRRPEPPVDLRDGLEEDVVHRTVVRGARLAVAIRSVGGHAARSPRRQPGLPRRNQMNPTTSRITSTRIARS